MHWIENKKFPYEELLIQPDEHREEIDLNIVCVYNNENCYRNELLASLKQQETSYVIRIWGINNVGGKYSSMCQAYNDVSNYIDGKWVVFLHQDIRFNNRNSLEGVMNEVNQLKNESSIWGRYGVVRESRLTVSTNHKPIRVETIDECFFGMSVSLLKKLRFNEQLCDNWHMYAVEVCLHNQCIGGQNYVIKSDITHLSPGSISKTYIDTLYKIIDYYKNKGVEAIWTTCAKVDLKRPYRLYIFIWFLKHEVLNKIIRPLKEKF